MYIRIIGDTGSIALDLAERVGTGFGLGILLVGRNRKLSGSSIGCCRSENLSSFVPQLECKVPSAILRYAVLEQSLGTDNVQFRRGRYNLSTRVTQNQAAVGHNTAAMDIGMVAGDNDLRGTDCLALGGVIRPCI